MPDISSLPQIITAIGGLGTAAFGLVDALKVFGGGPNHFGFSLIKRAVTPLTGGAPKIGLSQKKILDTLQANWFNGTDLVSQKAIAKSLIKLNLRPDNATDLAAVIGVNPDELKKIADKISRSEPLESAQSDLYARGDLIITAILDEAYQRADQVYRNDTRFLAMIIAIVLAIVGGQIAGVKIEYALIAGLLATPLAPIAKDISTALATAVNTMQTFRKSV
jgi:hypothetical protein